MPNGAQFNSVEKLVRYLRNTRVDFLDFGCSRGQSISTAIKILDADYGIGVDLDPEKLAAALKDGFDVARVDLLKLPDEALVRFVTMMHFLEHLSGYDEAKAMVKKACNLSREFVYIRQPFFDADGQLFQLGLKCYWSDWTGHRFSMTTLDFFRVLRDLRNEGDCDCFTIALTYPIHSSDHSAIIPLTAGINQHKYDPSKHLGKGPEVTFDFPVFSEVRVVVSKSRAVHDQVCRSIYWDHELMDQVSVVSARE
jgi:SAM-dependent methyltransferase